MKDEMKTNPSCDFISRADAIEAVRMSEHRITIADEQGGVGTVKWDMWGVYTAEAVEAIKALPSAEAVQGEWIEVEVFPEVYDIEGVKTWGSEMQCDQCGFRHTAIEGHMAQYNFCPNCGAKMSKGGDTE